MNTQSFILYGLRLYFADIKGLYICLAVLDCLQSAFSLKIPLVPISASALANYDVTLRSRLLRLACLGFACSNFAKKNKRLLAFYNFMYTFSGVFFLRNLFIHTHYAAICINVNFKRLTTKKTYANT